MGREKKVKVNKVKSKASKVSENVSIFVYLFYLCSGDSKVSTSQSTWVKLKVKVSVYLCLYLFHLTWDTALVECQTVSQAAVYALRAKSRSEQIKSKRKQDLCLYLHLWMYVNVSTCVLLMCLAHVPDPRHSAGEVSASQSSFSLCAERKTSPWAGCPSQVLYYQPKIEGEIIPTNLVKLYHISVFGML